MINFDKLDKNKTYVCLEYGVGKISKIIQKYSKEYCYDMEVPSHVFALVYDNRVKDWLIYESHMQGNKVGMLPSGVRKYYRVILEKVLPHVILHSDVYQLTLDTNQLEKLIGKPYGVGDIFALMNASKHHSNGKQKNRIGYICSEYIASAFPCICYHFNLPPHCITPSHFLRFVLDKDIEKIEP